MASLPVELVGADQFAFVQGQARTPLIVSMIVQAMLMRRLTRAIIIHFENSGNDDMANVARPPARLWLQRCKSLLHLPSQYRRIQGHRKPIWQPLSR